MSRHLMDRRHFLTVPLALLVSPLTPLLAPLARRAEANVRKGAYDVGVGLLYNTLSLDLAGTLDEAVDRDGGHYELKAVGQGTRIRNRMESRGIRRGGRWAPVKGVTWFDVAGREALTELAYDHEHRTVEYHYRGETFLLRRRRVADDVVKVPDGVHVDDAISALLNYLDGVWPTESDGSFLTHIVRRQRPPNEGPDDVQKVYRAELVPFSLRVAADSETGKPTAQFDMTRFSSWARENKPGRIVFRPDRRPELITMSLILGTSVNIRVKDAG